MFRRLIALCGAIAALSLPLAAQTASGFIPVNQTHLVDSTGATANNITVCAAPNGTSVRVGGGHGTTLTRPVCANVTNGAWSLALPDGSQSGPLNATYALTATDNVTGENLLVGYNKVQPHSRTCTPSGGQPGCVANVSTDWCSATACTVELLDPAAPPLAVMTQGPKGDTGINGELTLSALATIVPSAQTSYGTTTGANTGSPINIAYTKTLPTAVATSGYLASFSLNVNTFNAGSTFAVVILNKTGTNTFQQSSRFTLPIKNIGLNTYMEGTDFQNVQIAAGQWLAVVTGTSWTTQPFSADAFSSSRPFFFTGDAGTANQTFTGSDNFLIPASATITSLSIPTPAQTLAQVNSVLGIGTTSAGFFDPSVQSASTGVISVVDPLAVTASGTITQVKVHVFSVPSSASPNFNIVVYSGTSPNYTPVSITPVTLTTAADTTLNAGTDFAAINISAGQFFGYMTTANARVWFGNNGAAPAASFLTATVSVGTTRTFTTGGGPFSVGATITNTPTYLPSAQLPSLMQVAINAQQITVPTWNTSPWRGKNLCVWGHSLAAPGYEYSNLTVNGVTYTYWQQALAAQLGMTWIFNVGVVGAKYSQAFDNYPGLTLANMGATSIGTASGGLNNGPMTSETTITADLGSCDLLITWYGDNDLFNAPVGPIGSPGDAVAAGTVYGYADNFFSIVTKANPSMRIMAMGHLYSARPYSPTTLAGYQAITAIEKNVQQYYGFGYMDWMQLSGLNPNNIALFANVDGNQYIHPLNAGWSRLVPIMVKQLMTF